MNPYRVSTTVPMEGWFRFLGRHGLEPVLVSRELGSFHAWAVEQGVPSYCIPMPFPGKLNPFPFLRCLYQLRKVVRQHRIQLIHCNEHYIYPAGQYIARYCGLPVVVGVHSRLVREYCSWAFRGRRRPRRIFFLSHGSRKLCRKELEGIVPESDWRLLHNGLDLDHYYPDVTKRQRLRRELGLNGHLVIGAACALRPGKQLEHLFEVAARLSRPDLRVVLAGGPVAGEESYAQKVLEEGRKKLGDRLIYLGHLDDVRDFFNAVDITVNTSLIETCSISILQSLACGCPVVGYPSVSVDEQVLPGGGEIVRQDQVDSLAAALSGWLDDPARLNSARIGARQRAINTYDIRKIADQLWNEYQSLLN